MMHVTRYKLRVRRTKERETRMNNDDRLMPLRTYDFPADFCAVIRKEEERARSDGD